MQDSPEFEQERQKLKEWLLELVEKFREEYNRLSDEEKQFVGNTGYQPPCQIEVFWINEPVEWQILVMTHDSTRSDKEIIINGPYKGHEFFSELEKIMNEDRWNRAIPPDSPYYGAKTGTIRYSDIFAGILHNFKQYIESSIFHKRQKGVIIVWWFPNNGSCQLIYGRIDKLSHEELITKIIKSTKERKNRNISPTSEHPEKEERLKGYGTYFYPPVWIGGAPKFSFVQRVTGNEFIPPKTVLSTKFNNKHLLVQFDGFIGIVHENEHEALKWINIIFGIALLLDIVECYIAREDEISEVELDPKTMKIIRMTTPITTLRTYQVDPVVSKYAYHLRRRKVIPKEDIGRVIKVAESVIRDNELSNNVILLLSAFTHYEESEYPHAFVISWIIIEKYLSQLWKDYLKERGLNKKRIKKLTNSNLWHMDHILEVLNLLGKIDNNTYKLLMNLKSKRNKFIHDGKAVEKEDAKKALDLAISILRNKIKEIIGDGSHEE